METTSRSPPLALRLSKLTFVRESCPFSWTRSWKRASWWKTRWRRATTRQRRGCLITDSWGSNWSPTSHTDTPQPASRGGCPLLRFVFTPVPVVDVKWSYLSFFSLRESVFAFLWPFSSIFRFDCCATLLSLLPRHVRNPLQFPPPTKSVSLRNPTRTCANLWEMTVVIVKCNILISSNDI